MSYTFTKLFSGLTESTIWAEPYATRVLWVAMLSWADQHGRIFGSVPGIARRAGITREECDAALASFLAPDPDSRTPDHEGRRIEVIDGGWRLLNHELYRSMRDPESRRQQNREAQRRRREKASLADSADIADKSVCQPMSANVSRKSAQAEADTERDIPHTSVYLPAKRERKTTHKAERKRSVVVQQPGFDEFWSVWPSHKRKADRKKCALRWLANGCEDSAAAIIAKLRDWIASEDWQKDDGQYIPAPLTWLNQARYEAPAPARRRAPPSSAASIPWLGANAL